ncbi:MAG: tRNA 2-thiouridine(34) synthase MnmA [Coriobacteriia bacterium]|nr:tRNA 2-thiouridine(34) synthase MnmA [Coriobacteriia bacterium]
MPDNNEDVLTGSLSTPAETADPTRDTSSAEETITPPKGKVIAAMSGGVDSSVACALLHEEGYEVIGVTMRLFDYDQLANADIEAMNQSCCSQKDVEDARSVCWGMGLDHFAFNFTDRFESDVMDKFCKSYLAGETPNPCIDCNRFLKFTALQRRREQLGYDYVATGHYVRRCFDPASKRFLLKKGLDPKKDQSYVLYGMTQEQLAHTLFPLGELTKEETREVARRHGFVTAEKAESQDICFVPDGDYAAFIEKHEGSLPGPGPIVLEDGTHVGTHEGLVAYTPGQRKGLGVAWSEPLFVLRKDLAKNALVVGPRSSQHVGELWADDVNLISVAEMPIAVKVEAKVNYRATPVEAWARVEGDMLHVRFVEPIRSCATGQAVVLYQGDTVVGGGTIRSYR